NDKRSIFGLELERKNLGTHIGADLRDKSCPVCGHDSLVMGSTTGGTFCRNIPICEFLAPKCECGNRMIYTGQDSQRFYCSAHPENEFPQCPECSWGVLVPRVNSKTLESFTICHAKRYAHKPSVIKKYKKKHIVFE
ncbi:MAG: hypothetical protein RLZZ330_1, partial [Actinomycetota bacterium]